MDRLAAMLERLPPLYRLAPGSVVHELLAQVAGALAVIDEEMDRVQRSHFVDTAFDRVDLERLGALVGVPAAPFEPDELYKGRLKAIVAARLDGSVTPRALDRVLTRLFSAIEEELGVRYLEIPGTALDRGLFGKAPQALGAPLYEENPPARRRSPDLAGRGGLLRPLDRFVAHNGGVAPSRLEGVVSGVAGRRTAMPFFVNLTNGDVLAYAGVIPCGQQLRLSADQAGRVRAELDGVDVTSRVYSAEGFAPAVPFVPLLPHPEPQAIRLELGDNLIWFISVALFDYPGLDNAMYAMATPDMVQGVFATKDAGAGSVWDSAVFHQPPAVVLDAYWTEAVPATFRFQVPTGVIRRRGGSGADRLHDQLFALLEETVEGLAAAGVDGQVVPRPLPETQPMYDRAIVMGPDKREEASPGQDTLAGFGALFDLTAFDEVRAE